MNASPETQPVTDMEVLIARCSGPAFPSGEGETEGLSRHEYIAAMLLQGLLMKHGSISPSINDSLVSEAVRLATGLVDSVW